jgi:hypothetical protein
MSPLFSLDENQFSPLDTFLEEIADQLKNAVLHDVILGGSVVEDLGEGETPGIAFFSLLKYLNPVWVLSWRKTIIHQSVI